MTTATKTVFYIYLLLIVLMTHDHESTYKEAYYNHWFRAVELYLHLVAVCL